MARKQSEYLAGLLGGEADEQSGIAPFSPAPPPPRTRMTLLDRETALGRVASGELRQITQLQLDPARVRVWPGNARIYGELSEASCRELIDSIIAEGGQKMPAIVRRIEGDEAHDYEVIAGTRRHWAISWLRAHSYPDLLFVAQVHMLDDEAAFRLADIENRARADVTDFERARNYARALHDHYGGHQTRMAERLSISKGWLSKMIKVAAIPDAVVAAFATTGELQLKPTYPLAQALDDPERAKAILSEAKRVSQIQKERRAHEQLPVAASDVLRRLLAASTSEAATAEPYVLQSRYQRPLLTVISKGRQGLTLKLHAGSGARDTEVIDAVKRMLEHMREQEGVVLG